MVITWRRDAVSITATTTATTTATITAPAVAHPRIVPRRPAVRLLPCRMVREAAAADRTHSLSGYGRRFKV
jgi:hypothetical protein